MKKSLRTLTLSAAVVFSTVPMFANVMGTDPHPQCSPSVSWSWGDVLNYVMAVL